MYLFDSLVERLTVQNSTSYLTSMYNFHERVHRCGHYHKTLSWACDSPKARKSACITNTKTTAVTTEVAECGLANCNKKASPKREGLGQRFVSLLRTIWLKFGWARELMAGLMGLKSTGTRLNWRDPQGHLVIICLNIWLVKRLLKQNISRFN